jgi:hypothetical protein
MKEDREAEDENDRNEKENVETETFRHVDQHEQHCVNISSSRTMKRD